MKPVAIALADDNDDIHLKYIEPDGCLMAVWRKIAPRLIIIGAFLVGVWVGSWF